MEAKAIPGYTIKKKLGAGAMASVFLAREEKLDRDVALKVMSEKLLSDPSFAERFLREARIVASISHRNIVTVFDVGSHNGYHYMAMELLPGGDMTSKLRKGLPLTEAIAHVMDIAEGLQYAATKKFIHRDIKPDNIMFGEDGRAVITDFGIARNTESETNMTMAGSIIGTPQYMSPEQAGAKKLDHRTDLYSLGIILYEILTGKPPFKGDSAISTGVMHITQPVPELPHEFEYFQDFIDIALAKDPDDRFQSGREFNEALSQIDLGYYQDFEAGTELISPEDLERSLSSSGYLHDSGFQSNLKSGFNTGLDNIDPFTGSTSSGSQIHKNGKSTGGWITASILLFLLLGGVGAHTYYVNILGKRIDFESPATKLSNFATDVLVVQTDFQPVARVLSSASNGLATITANLVGQKTTSNYDSLNLNPQQQQLVKDFDDALAKRRYFFPDFNCAAYYLDELIQSDPQAKVVTIKSRELLKQIMDDTLELLNKGEIEEADRIISLSERLLPYTKDKNILSRHSQISSSIIIARQD